MLKRLLLPFTALVMLLSGLFFATPAHAATQYTVTTNPVPTVPGGSNITVTGRVTPAPAALPTPPFVNIWLDGLGADGTYYSHITDTTTKADGTWSITTGWGASVQGLLAVRAAYVDIDGSWSRGDWQYFSRENRLTVSSPINNSTAHVGTTLTITGIAYPARANDEIVIDIVDPTNTYVGGVLHTTTKADGSWTTALPANYPTGKLQIRAANYNGWWARTDYITVNLI